MRTHTQVTANFNLTAVNTMKLKDTLHLKIIFLVRTLNAFNLSFVVETILSIFGNYFSIVDLFISGSICVYIVLYQSTFSLFEQITVLIILCSNISYSGIIILYSNYWSCVLKEKNGRWYWCFSFKAGCSVFNFEMWKLNNMKLVCFEFMTYESVRSKLIRVSPVYKF